MNKFSTFNGIKEFIDLFFNLNFKSSWFQSETYNYKNENYNLNFTIESKLLHFDMFNDMGKRILSVHLYKSDSDDDSIYEKIVSNVIVRNCSTDPNVLSRVYDFDSRYRPNQINVYSTEDTRYDIYFDPNTITEEELFSYSLLYGSIFDFSLDCFKQMNELSISLDDFSYNQIILKIDLQEYQTKEDFLVPLYNLIQTTIDIIKNEN